MTAQPQDLKNLWRCGDCGRRRACPYAPMHTLLSGTYIACSCGDAAVVDESGADTAARAEALKFVIENNLF